MKAPAISRGSVHFRSESQSIIVIELLKYKERAGEGGPRPARGWIQAGALTHHVGRRRLQTGLESMLIPGAAP